VAAAVADGERLGLDLELPRRRRHWAGIAESCFSGAERRWIGDSADRFYRLWTMKEAWLKADGAALFGGLNRLELAWRNDRFRFMADRPARAWSLPWARGWMTIVGTQRARMPELFVFTPSESVPVDPAPIALSAQVLEKDGGSAPET
jgi:phosphopantetheinyl transferase